MPNCFRITSGRFVWYLAAASEDEMFSWIDVIRDYGGAKEVLPQISKQDIKEEFTDLSALDDETSESKASDDESVEDYKLEKEPIRYEKSEENDNEVSIEEIVFDTFPAMERFLMLKLKKMNFQIPKKRREEKLSIAKDELLKQQLEAQKKQEEEENNSDISYDSDEELWELLRTAEEVPEHQTKIPTPIPRRKKEPPKPQQQTQEIKDLFSYFVSKSEQVVEQEQKRLEEERLQKQKKLQEKKKKPTVVYQATDNRSLTDLNMAFKKIKITEPKRIVHTNQEIEQAVRLAEDENDEVKLVEEPSLLSKYSDVLTEEDNTSSSDSKSTSWWSWFW